MEHALWIGGPPGVGKTTIATRLARRHGLRWYNADTRTWAHRDRAIAAGDPAAIRWESLTPQQRWFGTTPEERLEQSLLHVRAPMVVDDVAALPRSPLVVAEGTTVLPEPRIPRDAAVWLLPTAELQRARLEERETPQPVAELYVLTTREIEREARERRMRVLELDGSLDVDDTVAAVEELFADALRAGPRAETLEERRALLRDGNESIVAQVRGFYARPWAEGDPETVTREFLCECGDAACIATVVATVGDAARAPLLAHVS